ncbi:MAG TPA: hypothetical protein VF572_03250 [Candidatus Saccharimonadales bacterium]|jgi:hypothetical protein
MKIPRSQHGPDFSRTGQNPESRDFWEGIISEAELEAAGEVCLAPPRNPLHFDDPLTETAFYEQRHRAASIELTRKNAQKQKARRNNPDSDIADILDGPMVDFDSLNALTRVVMGKYAGDPAVQGLGELVIDLSQIATAVTHSRKIPFSSKAIMDMLEATDPIFIDADSPTASITDIADFARSRPVDTLPVADETVYPGTHTAIGGTPA